MCHFDKLVHEKCDKFRDKKNDTLYTSSQLGTIIRFFKIGKEYYRERRAILEGEVCKKVMYQRKMYPAAIHSLD